MRSSSFTCRRCLKQLSTISKPSQCTRRWISSGKPPIAETTATTIRRERRNFTAKPQQAAPPPAEPAKQSTFSSNPDYYVTSLGHTSTDTSRELLKPDNLFHSWTNSPSPGIRKRAAFIKQHAYCPHPSHQRTRQTTSPADPENRKPLPGDSATSASPPAHVRFECPDCGIPVSCSKEHWEDDYESHLEICDTLREINEDDHDLHSGRIFPEFEYPGPQRAEEFILNMSNWDTFLYTRDFKAMDEMQPMRHVTKLMTYPVTIASVLHELSPYMYKPGARLTSEGLRSFSALRYTLHPPAQGESTSISGLRPEPPPIRIFILGARAESSLPRPVWLQLTHCFPRSRFHIIFIGPESMANRDAEFPLPERTPRNPFGGLVEDRLGDGFGNPGRLKVTTYVEYFQTMHAAQAFAPYDPYFDVFMLYHPGLGHPASSHEWADAVPMLLETKCPVICTGYTEWDMERDRRWVEETVGGEFDILLEPGENAFRSLRWDLNDLDPGDVSAGNWGVWAFRGKRYEAQTKDAE